MEFFGVEVPAGNPTTCSPGYGMYLHITQAALGDSKAKSGKGPERVVVKVSVDTNDEIVLGTLTEGKCDQIHLDLVFDRDVTISHNGKTSSVYFCGYRTEAPEEEGDDEDEFEEEEEKEKDASVPGAVPIEINGATEGKPSKAGKSEDPAKTLAKVTDRAAHTFVNALAKAVKESNAMKRVVENDNSEEEDESDEDEGLQHPVMSDLGSDSDDDDFDAGDDSDEEMDEDDEEEEDEEDDDEEDDEDESDETEEELKTPEIKAGKKRTAAEPVKAAEKKLKTDTSPKPEQVPVNGKKGKKAAQVTVDIKGTAPMTPTDSKETAPKTPTDKGLKPAKAPKGTPTAPPPTPVSAKKIGDYKCTPCDRTFTSEVALNMHNAAKHN